MHLRTWVLLAGSLSFAPLPSPAAEAAVRLAQATNHLVRLASAMTGRCLADVRSAADWTTQRDQRRQELRSMLGLSPWPDRTPLEARRTGVLERPDYRIEKWVFQSRPGLYVTANFYVPAAAPRPAPAILYLCGHSPHPHGAKTQYQNRTAWFAAHGYCVLVLDTLEFGEVPGLHHGTHDLARWDWISRGYTPAGVEVWNAVRALDWLETRPEVDAHRVGVTGISGGGATTWYLAALDERVAAAAPSCSTFTFGSQAARWLAGGQCDCIYYLNTAGWDFPVVAALIAPRPLLITSGQRDSIFPPDGYHQVYQRAKRVYDLLAGGDSDRIRELDADVGHSDPPMFLRAAREWMNRWLKDDARPLEDAQTDPPAESAELLACLDRLPPDAANFRIDREFVGEARPGLPGSAAEWETRRAAVLEGLRREVFPWFPRDPLPFHPIVSTNTGGWVRRYAACSEITFETEPGVRVRGELYSPTHPEPGRPLVVCLRSPGERFYPMDVDELLPLFGRAHVFVLSPRFTETTLSFAEFTDLERTAAWVGRTTAAMQVWDARCAIDYLLSTGLAPSRVSVHGRGDMASVALYAALFDDRIGQVILSDPVPSHRQGAAFLNVLRVTDLPEALGALAPRTVSFLGDVPPGFDLARDLYRLTGAGEAFRARGSLPEAVLP